MNPLTIEDLASWATAGTLIGIALYLLQVRGWRRVFIAGGLAFVAAFLVPDRKRSITPPGLVAVPPLDAGAPACAPVPEGHTMLAAPTEDVQHAAWEERQRGGS